MTGRSALVALVAALPASALKNALLRRLGWVIGEGAYIGPCLVLNVDRVELGNQAAIGAFNVIRDLAGLQVGDGAVIGHWNWITAARPQAEAGAPCHLDMREHTALTARHYVDCTGGIRIGSHSTIAGVRSTLLTHGISWKASAQTFSPIEIGTYCLISSNVHIAPGSVIGDKIVIGMGATAAGRLEDPGLYLQSRAELVKSDLSGEYFHRELGRVSDLQTGG